MIQYQVTNHINRPVEQVFEFILDERNLSKWQSDFVEGEQLIEGSMDVGTRFREFRRMSPRQVEIQAEVTTFGPNKRFSTKTLTTPKAPVSYVFESENGGTRITYAFTLITSGIMRLLEPLMTGSMKKGTEADFQRLKEILEQ